MANLRLWVGGILMLTLTSEIARASPVTPGADLEEARRIAEDQNQLGEAYLKSGTPIAAVAPLLTALRQPGIVGADNEYRAKLNLARAYLALGLFGSANQLLIDLGDAPQPWREGALAARVELHMLRGEAEAMLASLHAYQSLVTGGVAPDLIFRVAKAAFASHATGAASALFQEISTQGALPEAKYFVGVGRLLERDIDGAFRIFQDIRSTYARARNPEFFDHIQLAIGRIYYENASYQDAELFYASIPDSSPAYDRALYEAAWVYLAQGEVTAATGNLLQLVIARPFSPLVPRAQVLYGYLLLRRGEFMSAEASFGRYIAHYAALTDRIADLASIAQPETLYDSLFGDADRAIAAGQSLTVELLAWLERNPRLTQARKLVGVLQTSEEELAEVARTLRDVQALSEAGQRSTGMSAELEAGKAHMDALETRIRGLEQAIEAGVVPWGERLTGAQQSAFVRLQKQLMELRALRKELLRQEKRSLDKRYELVSLLQYADASQWGIWLNGELAKSPATEPVALRRGELTRMFEKLDQTDEQLALSHGTVHRLEEAVLATRMQILLTQIRPRVLAPTFGKQGELLRLHAEWIRLNQERTAEQKDIAVASRSQIDSFVSQIQDLRRQLVLLSHQGVRTRGQVARTELGLVDQEIGSLLVHARLGNADVAWNARRYIQQRTREIAGREQADMDSLQAFYRSLDTSSLAPQPMMPGSVTGSTGQKVYELATRAENYRANLARVTTLLQAQRQASAQLVSRLKQEGHHDDAVGRTDAAGLLFQQSPEAAGFKLETMALYLDGRRITRRGDSIVLDRYLQPGMHQIDAAFTYTDGDGQPIRLNGSFHFVLERAQGYRLIILPELTSASKNLRFSLQKEEGQ